MRPASHTREPVANERFFIDTAELRSAVIGGGSSAIRTNVLFETWKAALDFVGTSLGYSVRNESHGMAYAGWPAFPRRFDLEPLVAGSSRAKSSQFSNLSISYANAEGVEETVPQEQYRLDDTGSDPVIHYLGASPQTSRYATAPIEIKFDFAPGALSPTVQEASVVVFRALFESRLANTSFRSMDVRKAITSLLSNERARGARYA